MMTPKSGNPAEKFLVPSIGSTMNANSASARRSSSAGLAAVASSPTTVAPGKRARNMAVIAVSAASSASVTMSWIDVLNRMAPGDRLRQLGRISVRATSRMISTTERASPLENFIGIVPFLSNRCPSND